MIGIRLRALLAVVAVLAGWMLIATVVAAPASAHAGVEASSPPDGSRLARSPAEVSVTFSEEVSARFGQLQVTDARGRRVDVGPIGYAANDRTVLIVALKPNLPVSGYLVTWTTVSADSHAITGSFSFAVGNAPMLNSTGGVAGGRYLDPLLSILLATIRWFSLVALVMIAGTVLVVVGWAPARTDRRIRRLVLTGAALSGVTAIAAVLLEGPYATGGSLGSSLSPGLIQATLSTPFGRLLALRSAAAAIVFWLAFRLFRDQSRIREEVRQRQENLGIAAALVLGISFAAAGHAVGDDVGLVTLLVNLTHLNAMAIWLGGLMVLAVGLIRAGPAPAGAAEAVRRFSTMAAWLVAIVAVTGLYLAWRTVGSVNALWSTPYGRLLDLKLTFVLVLLALGNRARQAVQRQWLQAPRLPESSRQLGWQAAAGGVAAKVRNDADITAVRSEQARLRHIIALELTIAAVVLAITAVLVAQEPPARRPSRPISAPAQRTMSSAQTSPLLLGSRAAAKPGLAILPSLRSHASLGDAI